MTQSTRRKISLIGFGLMVLASCEQNQKAPPTAPPALKVSTLSIVPKDIPMSFEYVGVVQGYHNIEIRSRVEGFITQVAYKEGHMVKEGDLLFKIDPTQFEAALDSVKGDLAVAEANLWNAKRSVERLKPLYEQNAASRKDLDEAMASLNASEAQVSSAKAKVKQAELNLGYTSIISPISGLAGVALYREGSLILPGSSNYLTKVSTINPIYVDFHVSEADVLKSRYEIEKNLLKPPSKDNYQVQLTLANGSVYPILGTLEFADSTFRPETSTMLIRAVFSNPKDILLPGQFVRANVLGAIRPNGIAIPQRAVMQSNKGMFVYLVKEGKAVAQKVEPGEWVGNNWLINFGLEKGDIVIIDGTDQILPGMSVEPHEGLEPKSETK